MWHDALYSLQWTTDKPTASKQTLKHRHRYKGSTSEGGLSENVVNAWSDKKNLLKDRRSEQPFCDCSFNYIYTQTPWLNTQRSAQTNKVCRLDLQVYIQHALFSLVYSEHQTMCYQSKKGQTYFTLSSHMMFAFYLNFYLKKTTLEEMTNCTYTKLTLSLTAQYGWESLGSSSFNSFTIQRAALQLWNH